MLKPVQEESPKADETALRELWEEQGGEQQGGEDDGGGRAPPPGRDPPGRGGVLRPQNVPETLK